VHAHRDTQSILRSAWALLIDTNSCMAFGTLASVIGSEFTFSVLRAIYPIRYGIQFLSQDIKVLVESDFLLASDSDDECYTFKSNTILWVCVHRVDCSVVSVSDSPHAATHRGVGCRLHMRAYQTASSSSCMRRWPITWRNPTRHKSARSHTTAQKLQSTALCKAKQHRHNRYEGEPLPSHQSLQYQQSQ
jgi:hypothetical protein